MYNILACPLLLGGFQSVLYHRRFHCIGYIFLPPKKDDDCSNEEQVFMIWFQIFLELRGTMRDSSSSERGHTQVMKIEI